MSDALYEAADAGDLVKVRTLLANGASRFAANEDNGQYPFMNALTLPVRSSLDLKQRKEDIFNLLRPEFPDIHNYVDRSGETMVHYLIKFDYAEPLSYLMRQAAASADYSIFSKGNNFDQKPIHAAIMCKREDMVADLLQIPNMKTTMDWNNRNLIHHMAHYGTPAMLRSYCDSLTKVQLFEYINATDIDGKTPYQFAKDYNSTDDRSEIMEILVAHGATVYRSFSPFE